MCDSRSKPALNQRNGGKRTSPRWRRKAALNAGLLPLAWVRNWRASRENARSAFNWEGAFVYEGMVYDHINYRLRQSNDRYTGDGKRSMRFRFNDGNFFQARIQSPACIQPRPLHGDSPHP